MARRFVGIEDEKAERATSREYRKARTDYTREKIRYMQDQKTTQEENKERRARQEQADRKDYRRSRIRSRAGQINRQLGKARPSQGLLAEMAAAAIIIALDDIAIQHIAPPPSSFIAAFVVFMGLSILASFGQPQARFAMWFGGFTVIVIMLNRIELFKALGSWFTGSQQPKGKLV